MSQKRVNFFMAFYKMKGGKMKVSSSIVLLFILITLVFLGGTCECPLTPKPEEDYNLVESETIGPEGGTLDADSFMVTVPPGAFSSDIELKIYASTEDRPFDEYGISSVYQIEGLLEEYAQPIRINIKYHGTLSGDTLVAVGEIGFAPSLDDTALAYYTVSARDSSGYLIFELPATTSGRKGNKTFNGITPPIRILALGGYIRRTSANGHFRIAFPAVFVSSANQLAGFSEAAHDTFQTMGFKYTGRTWPVNVTVKKLNVIGMYTSYWPTNPTAQNILKFLNKGHISINSDYLTDMSEIRATPGHEFFHLVQNIYKFTEHEQIWLEEACAVWSEEKFTEHTNYVSSSIDGNEMEPFKGWQIATDDHGYGMSVLIKDLVEVYGENVVLDIYSNINAGAPPTNPVHPVDAVLSSFTEPVENLWHGLLGAYILGHYYNNQVNHRFLDDLDNYSGTFEISSTTDTLETFTDSYQDLSGNLYKVELNYADIDSNASLQFTVDDPSNCGILACKYKQGDTISQLNEVFPGGEGTVTVDSIRELTDEGWDIVALVTNSRHVSPYTGTNDINLEIKVTKATSNFVTDKDAVTIPEGAPPLSR